MSDWVEIEPFGPGPAGDCGGDHQVGEAYSRRWAMRVADGWAMTTVAFYVEKIRGEASVNRQVEYLLCTDLQDPGGTEWWSEYLTDTLCIDGEPTEASAREWCAAVDIGDYRWDGTAA